MQRIWVIAPFDYTLPEAWERVWAFDLRRGIISIGWLEIGSCEGLTQAQILQRHRKAYRGEGQSTRRASQAAWMLYKFWKDIHVGDLVIARRGTKQIAAIGEVTSRAFFEPRLAHSAFPADIIYPNHLRVEWYDAPRDVMFDAPVFGVQAIHAMTKDRFRTLMEDFAIDSVVYPDEFEDETEYPEGAKRTIVVNAYERNAKARSACLAKHGYRCQVCGLLMEELYGEIGHNFIHVHHLTPIAASKKRYHLNPVRDLAPVCPNCHAMLHTSNPPLSISELKARYQQR